MPLSASTVWEVRSATGNDTNGGGFVAGASGTDWSQQALPQYSVTDGVAAGTSTIISATANFGVDVVGNIIYIQGGTGSITAGWYHIIARVNSTTITVDRSTGLTSGTGVTLRIGGALATFSKAATLIVEGNKVFATGSETITASITFGSGGTSLISRAIGYGSSRNDSGFYGITLNAVSLTGIVASGLVSVRNFTIDCASQNGSTGIRASSYYERIDNCKVKNFKTNGIITFGNQPTLIRCEVSGGITGATSAITAIGTGVYLNHVHDNACPGIVANNSDVCDNIVVNSSGASSDGISSTNGGMIMRNTVHNSGRNGIIVQNRLPTLILGNILTNNASYGLNYTVSIASDSPYDGNAFYNNSGGNRFNCDDTNGTGGISPYINLYDVTLTGLPYINATTNPTTANWGLNATAGGGAACKQAFGPSAFNGNTNTRTYPDFGAAQLQVTDGSGGVKSYSFGV